MSVPVVTITILIEGGTGSDPAGQEGLAAFVADMADEGTGSLSAIDVSDQLARIGAQYDADVGADSTIYTLTTLTRFAERGAELLAGLVTRPSLREADFVRVRQLRLDRLRQMKDVPPTVADRAFLRLLYGSHPYGHLAIGTDTALRALTLDDVEVFHARQSVPSRATLVVVGALSHEELLETARGAFADWTGPVEVPSPHRGEAVTPADFAQGARLAIVPRESAAQSELRIGHLGTGRNTPDYAPLLVMNAVLGGQFVSRVNLKLREEKGYTYGARTGFDWRRGPTPFMLQASVHTASTAYAVGDALAELDGIRGSRPPTAGELLLAKASLTRGYPRNFETAQQVARSVCQLALYDLPDSYFADFVPKANSVTAEQVAEATQRHLDPARLTTLIVGDYAVIGDSLATLAQGEVQVLPND
jgi:predicted Zn-dependent peptidase